MRPPLCVQDVGDRCQCVVNITPDVDLAITVPVRGVLFKCYRHELGLPQTTVPRTAQLFGRETPRLHHPQRGAFARNLDERRAARLAGDDHLPLKSERPLERAAGEQRAVVGCERCAAITSRAAGASCAHLLAAAARTVRSTGARGPQTRRLSDGGYGPTAHRRVVSWPRGPALAAGVGRGDVGGVVTAIGEDADRAHWPRDHVTDRLVASCGRSTGRPRAPRFESGHRRAPGRLEVQHRRVPAAPRFGRPSDRGVAGVVA